MRFVTPLIVICLGTLWAEDRSVPRIDGGAQKMMSKDSEFAIKAALGGMAEVQLGQLAAQKAANPDVKAFGQQMAVEHGKANDQLKAVATQERMTLPAMLDAGQAAALSTLQRLSGAAFDKAYVKNMLKEHSEDVKEFQKESKTGKDDQLKSFASQMLPVIRGNLEKIKSIDLKLRS